MLRLRPLFLLLLLLTLLTACDPAVETAPPLPTAAPTAAPPNANAGAPTAPPLPTATLPAPPPPATINAALDAWTLLIYMDADNDLEPAALQDLDELQAAATLANINVLVQLDRRADSSDGPADWADTRRLRLQPGPGSTGLVAEVVEVLGEANMGDQATLAAFVAWGVAAAPANRYGLILWDHGAGWFGTTFDQEQMVARDGADRLTMPELSAALADGLAQAGLEKLDLIGFDGCLMGQLDVLTAVAPHARYAVGSQELIPGRGFDYTALLNGLAAAPDKDGAALSGQIVDDFYAYYAAISADDFITLAAVDLTAAANIVDALEVLTVALQRDPALTAPAVGDARSGAEAYARFYRDQFERYASIDLWHFAAILAQRVPDPQTRAAAERLKTEIERAVLLARRGTGFRQAHGVAIYFPREAANLSPDYAAQTTLPGWASFLQTYFRTRQAALAPPAVHIVSTTSMTISVQAPAYLGFELIGQGIEEVVLYAGQIDFDSGRRRLVEANPLRPEPLVLADGTMLDGWRDGLHDDFFVWLPEATFLTDGEDGDFVVMWPTYDDTRWAVEGQLLPAGGGPPITANLVFDTARRRLDAVWALQSGAGDEPPYELPIAPGDRFQVDELFLGDQGIERLPGVILALGAEDGLRYAWRPLPAGTYFAGFEATNEAGQSASDFSVLLIDNSGVAPGFKAYLDPYLGFQFFYPGSGPRRPTTPPFAAPTGRCSAPPSPTARRGFISTSIRSWRPPRARRSCRRKRCATLGR